MWSIGMYRGDSPYHLSPAATVPNLTGANVTDVPAGFVADPFMVGGHMFFEVWNLESSKGQIGLATSDNGLDWIYQETILNEPFHLSYPYVFEWQSEYYMIPETLGAHAVCLYRADDFPTRWTLVKKLIEGQCADPSIVRFSDRWWLFTCSRPHQHDTLLLYFADELTGPWHEHPKSPIIKNDPCRARPAGRILTLDDKLIRFAQDCVPLYGTCVRAFDVIELTTTDYVEVENRASPILRPGGTGWNALGMHHVDGHRQEDGSWLACVDGFR